MPPAAHKDKDKEKKPAPPAYVAPTIHVGDIVMWHPDQDSAPDTAAIVTAVSGETINLSCFGNNFFNMHPREGVRHKDHPNRQIVAATEEGVWSKHPTMIALEARLEALESLLLPAPAA